MNRILVFHVHETTGNQIRMAPSAYYVDAEYEPIAVRLYTETTGARDIGELPSAAII